MKAFGDPAVKAVSASYEPKMRGRLMVLREMIFAAAESAKVGPLSEPLKWGQPAYRPLKARTGTTVRLDALRNVDGGYALFVPCSTTLIASFREQYARDFVFEGKRAIVFSLDGRVPEKALKHCSAMALDVPRAMRPRR
jgi:hypothetical protein